MYADPYFPDVLVDKVKASLLAACERIEWEKPSNLAGPYRITHAATEEINQLAQEFEDSGSEIETAARDAIGEEFIAMAYGYNADAEELTAPATGELHRGADHQRPERLELGLGILHQRDAHVLGVRQQQVLVVPRASFQPLQHLVDVDLAGADVLGRDLRVVAGALDAVPRIGAVRAVVRDAIPFRQVARMRLGRIGELRR